MFHVKHRTALTVSTLIVAALLASGCTGTTSPATGWMPPVAGPNGILLVQSAPGRITTAKSDGSRIAEYEIRGAATTNFLGRTSQGAATPIYATPLVDGTAAYVVSYAGRVVRLNLDNGALSEKWIADLHENVVATPVLRGDRLYVSAENGQLSTINTTTGKILGATHPTAGRVWGAPALQDGRIFIGTLDSSEVIAVNADSGATEWRRGGVGAAAADLVVDGNTLVVPSFDRTIHALDSAGGTEKWRFTGDGWFVGKPLVTQQGIYAGTLRGSVYALDRSGKLRWVFARAGLEFRAAPILVGDTLVMADRSGVFIGLNANTGAEKWTQTAEHATIDANGVLLDSGLFFTTTTYSLIRLDPVTGESKTFNVQPPKGDGK